MGMLRLGKPVVVLIIMTIIVNTVTVDSKLNVMIAESAAKQTAEDKAAKETAKAEAAAAKAAEKAADQAAKQAAKEAAQAEKAAIKAEKAAAKEAAQAEKAAIKAEKAAAKEAAQAEKAAIKAEKAAAKEAAKAEKTAIKAEKIAAKEAARVAKQAEKAAVNAGKMAVEAAIKAEKAAEKAAIASVTAGFDKSVIPSSVLGANAIKASHNTVLRNIMKSELKESPKAMKFIRMKVAADRYMANLDIKSGQVATVVPSTNGASSGISNVSQVVANDNDASVNAPNTIDAVFRQQMIELANAGSISVTEDDMMKVYLEDMPENFVEIAGNLTDEQLANMATAAGGELEVVEFVDISDGDGLIYMELHVGQDAAESNDKRSPIKIDNDMARRIRTKKDDNGETLIELGA